MKHVYDAQGVDPVSGFQLIPEGQYRVVITDVKESLSRTNRDMVNVTCEIAEEGSLFGSKLWHNVTFIPKGEKGAGFALHFLHAIGQPYEGVFEWDSELWIGSMFYAKIVHEIGTDNIKRAKIGQVIIPKTEAEEKKQASDDEVPW